MKTDHPALPLTIPEILDAARSCFEAGAHAIHLHIRNDKGQHSLCIDTYQKTINAIEAEVPGMAIQVTTEAAGVFDVPAQLAVIQDLKPKAASIAVREILRAPDLVRRVYHTAAHVGTDVQHILYSRQDINDLRHLIDAGDVPDTMRDVLLVLGTYTPPVLAAPSDVAPFISALQGDFPNWTVCAFGQTELATAQEAIRLGGHIRIGFENNIQTPDGRPAKDNAENITRAVTLANSVGRPLITRNR